MDLVDSDKASGMKVDAFDQYERILSASEKTSVLVNRVCFLIVLLMY